MPINLATLKLSRGIADARQSVGAVARKTPGIDEPQWHATRAASTFSLDLSEDALPYAQDPRGSGGRLRRVPNPSPAGDFMTLGAVMAEQSLVAQAGASIIIAAERPIVFGDSRVDFYRDAGLFRIVEPFDFILNHPDDTDTPDSPWPLKDAGISWPDAPTHALSYTITRSARRAVGGEMLDEHLMDAMIMGLSRQVDRVLVSALADALAAAPAAPFSLAQAAARGFHFEELRALVGTAGNGATVNEVGDLKAAGVTAELTPVAAETYLGAWSRAAVAIDPRINVIVDRLNLAGKYKVTAFVNMLPLIPDPSAFWTVGA